MSPYTYGYLIVRNLGDSPRYSIRRSREEETIGKLKKVGITTTLLCMNVARLCDTHSHT